MEYVLETRGITKNFTGTKALDNVSIFVKPGEVHGIVGENGAGKSTLMNILSGIYRKDSGEVFLNGQPVEFNNPNEAIRNGIGIVHQEVSIVPNLSVAENIFANRQPVNRLGMINRKKMYADARQLLDEFGVKDIEPAEQVRFLTIAQQQVLEILKAISCNPSVLILDEPTSSLTDNESEALFAYIRRLKEKGTSFIYISHHLDEIFRICDSISILKDGKFVCRAEVADIDQPFIVRNMVGREIKDEYGSRDRSRKPGDVVFEAQKVGRVSEFANVDFKLHKGEIVGVFGLVGAGRTELASSFVGLTQPETGTLLYEGKPVKIKSVRQAISMGMAYVSEDRKNSGLFLKKTIQENIVANKLGKISKGPFVSKALGDKRADEAIDRYSIACSAKEQTVGDLSGGNQQKVLVAEWLSDVPKILIVDEPTKGIDVGSRSQIYGFLNELADQGTAVMMISSDLMEIIGMSDRVVVMRDGFVVGEVAKEDMTEENILSIATGVSEEGRITS